MSTGKEVMTAEQKELAALEQEMAGHTGDIDSSDILIPKLMVMQGLSEMVIEGKAKFGDFVNSVSEEIIGAMDKPVVLTPFYVERKYYVSKLEGNDFKFDHVEDYTLTSKIAAQEAYNTVPQVMRYQLVYNFYCINPTDMSIPMILSCKGMSSKAGKQLITQAFMPKAGEKYAFPYRQRISVSGEKQSNDKGTFVVIKIALGDRAEAAEQIAAIKWLKTIEAGKTKADSPEEEAAKEQF